MAIAPAPAEKLRLAKMRTSNSGPSRRNSYRMKETSERAATTNTASVVALRHPQDGPSIMARVSVATPTVPSTSPPRSTRRRLGLFDSGTTMAHATRAITTRGALIKKIEPYQKCTRRAPPTTGPMAMAAPAAAPHTPNALARSLRFSKVIVTVDKVAGKIKAADAAITEKTPNRARPVIITRLRPNRSESPPPAKSRAAKGREYASTIHCSDEFDACRSFDRTGSATLTMVLSITTIRTMTHRTPSTHQRRS